MIPGYKETRKVSLEEEMAVFQCSWLENSMDRGAWWTIVHGVAELDVTE